MPAPDPYSMYFIAVLCPPAIDESIQKYKLWMRDHFGCTVALKSAAHITLVTPFWVKNESERLLIDTLQSFETDKLPAEIELQGFSHFSNRVIFVTVNENQQLAALRNETEDHFIQSFRKFIKPDERPFHPHVTIANRDIKPADFIKAWEHFSREKLQESFSTNTLSLLKLTQGKWTVLTEKNY